MLSHCCIMFGTVLFCNNIFLHCFHCWIIFKNFFIVYLSVNTGSAILSYKLTSSVCLFYMYYATACVFIFWKTKYLFIFQEVFNFNPLDPFVQRYLSAVLVGIHYKVGVYMPFTCTWGNSKEFDLLTDLTSWKQHIFLSQLVKIFSAVFSCAGKWKFCLHFKMYTWLSCIEIYVYKY